MNNKVSLVLSSGGSRGLAQIGAINELEKQGFEIKSVAGSSIGSIIGGLYAMGMLNKYTEWVKTLNKRMVWGLMDFTVSTHGLLKGEKVFERLKTFIPDMNIEEMKIPFAAVATDIINNKEIVFTQGSFYEAIRASMAVPAIFTPVNYKDTILVDGGILNPIPIDHVKGSKEDIVVVVNLYGRKTQHHSATQHNKMQLKNSQQTSSIYKNIQKLVQTGDRQKLGYYSLLMATTEAMVYKLANQNIEKFQPEIVINIPSDVASTFDFYKAEELIELGQLVAKEAIKKYNNRELQ